MDLPLIPILGLFGGNQLKVAFERSLSRSLNDVWILSSAWRVPCYRLDVARRGNTSMAFSSAVNSRKRTFLIASTA